MKKSKLILLMTAIMAVAVMGIAAIACGQNGYMHATTLSVILYISGRTAWSKKA